MGLGLCMPHVALSRNEGSASLQQPAPLSYVPSEFGSSRAIIVFHRLDVLSWVFNMLWLLGSRPA